MYIERMEEELDAHFIEAYATDAAMSYEMKTSERVHLKEEKIQEQVTKLYLKGGKNKKIRPGDIVGAILENKNVTFEDIGVVEVLEHQSYVDILNGKGEMVLEDLKNRKIKNKKIVVEKAK